MIIKKIDTNNNTSIDEITFAQYLRDYNTPLPPIRNFVVLFSANPLPISSMRFHYFYNSPSGEDVLRQSCFYFIEAPAIDVIEEGTFAIEARKMLVFSVRSVQDYYKNMINNNNLTTLLFTSYPDEQGMLIKLMILRRNVPVAQASNYNYVYLVARFFNLNQPSTIMQADTVQKYINVVIWKASSPQNGTSEIDIVKKIYCSTSWYFDILLPFRLEISDTLVDSNT
ncbi:MAG: hypothetical protein ACK4F9_06275 [Brevinematia bacterium]